MTDERLCGVCGHEESAHVGDDPNGQVCTECDGNGEHELMLHAFDPSSLPRPEAAPSTDEGEAQEGGRTLTIEEARIELYDSLPHPFSCGGREQPRTYYAQTCTCYARDVVEAFEAAIRAPLEERIRERDYTVNLLEAEASQFRTIIGRERAEVERLREALRTIASWGVDPANRAGELSLIFQYAERALATPPSSTEGTKEVEG